MAVSPKKATQKRDAKNAISGAVGGPSTGAGLNYQVNYAVLRLLKLLAEFLNMPFGTRSVEIEPRVVTGEGQVTRWDLGIALGDELIEVKLRPTKQDLSEWTDRVRQSVEPERSRFLLVYSRATVTRLLSLRELVR